MDQDNKRTSGQHRGFLGNFRHIYEKTIDWIGLAISFFKKFRPSSVLNAIIRDLSSDRFAKVVYYVVLFAGMSAAGVSAMIEYQVITEVYNRETDIANLPVRMLKVARKVILGNPQAPADAPPTQQDSSRKAHSWLPVLFVFAVEGMKCSLIYYKHSRREESGQRWSTLVRGVLIFLSFSCTLIFLAELMNKPNEDEINGLC